MILKAILSMTILATLICSPVAGFATGSKEDGLRCIAWINGLSAVAPKNFLRDNYISSRVDWVRLNTELSTGPLAEIEVQSLKTAPDVAACDEANLVSKIKLLPLERFIRSHRENAKVVLLKCAKAMVISDFVARSAENQNLLARLFEEGKKLGIIVSALNESVIGRAEFKAAFTEKLSLREMSEDFLTSSEFQQLTSSCKFLDEPAPGDDPLPSGISDESKAQIRRAEEMKDKWISCVVSSAKGYFATGISATDSAAAAQAKCNEPYSKWAEYSEVVFMGLVTPASKEQAVLRAKATVTDVRTKVTNEVVKALVDQKIKDRSKKTSEKSDSLL